MLETVYFVHHIKLAKIEEIPGDRYPIVTGTISTGERQDVFVSMSLRDEDRCSSRHSTVVSEVSLRSSGFFTFEGHDYFCIHYACPLERERLYSLATVRMMSCARANSCSVHCPNHTFRWDPNKIHHRVCLCRVHLNSMTHPPPATSPILL